jgi:outer membrane protein assembly factor BamB
VAYKVEEANGKPVLTQAWVSRNMSSPEPPVITNGVVFALSAGESTHATLYALDAATGKEMYSTGDQVTAPGNLTGITLANGRVYFTTNDGTLYAFGIFLER